MGRAAEILGVGGNIAERLPGYQVRPEQLQLAEAIEDSIAASQHLLAEAGTGTGKSFAYLVPAILAACGQRDGGPVIVSTRTIALQEQLEHRDLPFLQAVLPLEWSSVTAVGRNHYLCLRRMNLALRERGVLFPDAEHEAQLIGVSDWSMRTMEGTRMSLDSQVDNQVWDEVKAEHGNCLHKACQHYRPCHYQRSRRQMDRASILVVNHSLYMADVALRMAGASYLPEHRLVIFDEAHHLEQVATESLGLRINLGSILWQLRRLMPKHGRGLLNTHGNPGSIALVEALRGEADAFFAALAARLRLADSQTLALGDQALDDPLSPLLQQLGEDLIGISLGIETLDLRMEMQARARGIEALRASLSSLCTPTGGDTSALTTVRWIESGPRSPELRSAPLEVAEALRDWVFDQRPSVLLSATLGPSSDEKFSWIRQRLGIGEAKTLRLGSPFDFGKLVRLEIPEAIPDPVQDPSGFSRACCSQVLAAILDNGGHALVLCTSWRSVHELAEYLQSDLADAEIELLIQGDAPLRKLLDRKRSEPSSVLLGTESLWEGIDLPGDALTLLIITRLPFAQPDHPLTRARHERILERGGNPFFDHSLPEAVLRFRQGFGRLVRRSDDHGKVLILDPRLRTRRYGREFLLALPEGLEPD